jgi:hypothetical protein
MLSLQAFAQAGWDLRRVIARSPMGTTLGVEGLGVTDPVGWRADRLDTRLAQSRLAAANVGAVGRELARWHAEHREAAAAIASPDERVAELRARTGSGALAACDRLARIACADAARFAARADHAVRLHGGLALDAVYVDADAHARFAATDASHAGDPALDVAALRVALCARGRADLADHLAAAYCEEADDFALYGVLDFWESLVAVERGGPSPAPRVAARPSLVAVASGTADPARIALELGAPLVAASQLREAPADPWSLFLAIAGRAAEVLDAGRTVVVAGPFASPSAHHALERLARGRGVALRFAERTARRVARVRAHSAHPTVERSTPRRAPLLSTDSPIREEHFE